MILLHTTAAVTLVLAAVASGPVQAEGALVEVYRSPSCGCCEMWVEHLAANGYHVRVRDVDDLQVIKQLAGVPSELQSCHTAMVDGYVLEGHVPVATIDRLLEDRPAVQGLAVPGMPAGSPGMPSDTPERYRVFTFDQDGVEPYATFTGPEQQ